MPRRYVHEVVGVLAGGVAAIYVARRNAEKPLAAIIQVTSAFVGGLHGGRLPDLIEPAEDPGHRGFAHSWTVVVAGGAAITKWGDDVVQETRSRVREIEEDLEGETNGWRRAWLTLVLVLGHMSLGYSVGLAAGYASHVGLDAMTPGALPLLARRF
jgi:membrane-bound metal-dependent hydrolase YbcI (DUF457 family)